MTKAGRILGSSLKTGGHTGLFTLWQLLKVMVPIMILMSALDAWGVLPIISGLFRPAMSLLGLPGDAALVFVAGAGLNLYTAVAVAANLSLSVKQITVLAVLCLDCHNLPVECAVQKQAGNGVLAMLTVRLLTGLAAAFAFSRLIPSTGVWAQAAKVLPPADSRTGWDLFWADLMGNGIVLVKVAVIVMVLMIFVEFLRQTGVLKVLTWVMRPLVWLAGLPKQAAFTVMASSTLGLAYGAGLVIAEAKQGHLSRDGQFRTNVFIGTTHSLWEDTGLFAILGASIWWIVLGRLVVGALAVRFFALARVLLLRLRPASVPPQTG
jgi:spore maturation protein SpmB